jgi:hypothetical protein
VGESIFAKHLRRSKRKLAQTFEEKSSAVKYRWLFSNAKLTMGQIRSTNGTSAAIAGVAIN